MRNEYLIEYGCLVPPTIISASRDSTEKCWYIKPQHRSHLKAEYHSPGGAFAQKQSRHLKISVLALTQAILEIIRWAVSCSDSICGRWSRTTRL
jgi:hypothetical protein